VAFAERDAKEGIMASTKSSGTAAKKSARKASSKGSAPKAAPKTAPEATGGERTKYFTASWCPPCQLVHRMLAKHPDLAARLEVIDVDAHEALAERYGVDAVPTFVRPDGVRETGAMTVKELRAFLDG
jgi:thiol-disulfide isomerase/thioredoxin